MLTLLLLGIWWKEFSWLLKLGIYTFLPFNCFLPHTIESFEWWGICALWLKLQTLLIASEKPLSGLFFAYLFLGLLVNPAFCSRKKSKNKHKTHSFYWIYRKPLVLISSWWLIVILCELICCLVSLSCSLFDVYNFI